MTIKERLGKFDELKGVRQNWESYWSDLHDQFYVESSDLETSYPGTELNTTKLYDSTPLESADVLASGLG